MLVVNHTHINVSIDFTNWGDAVYDLRIPIQLTVKQLLLELEKTLGLNMSEHALFAIKVTTKQLLLADDDYVMDFPVTDGDYLIIL